jgi:hypothetical protein
MYKTGTLVILCTRIKKDFSLPPPPSLHSFLLYGKRGFVAAVWMERCGGEKNLSYTFVHKIINVSV